MKTITTILLLAFAAGQALAQDVRYNFASGVNFGSYRTYRWVHTPGSEDLDQITESQLRAAIDEELAAKGMTKVDGDSADTLLSYQTSLGQEKQVTTLDSGMGYGPGWGWYGYGGGGGYSTSTTSTIVTGQLVLDIYDAKAKSMIWRGTATKTLDLKAKPEKRQKNIRKAAAKLLKNYPPPIKK